MTLVSEGSIFHRTMMLGKRVATPPSPAVATATWAFNAACSEGVGAATYQQHHCHGSDFFANCLTSRKFVPAILGVLDLHPEDPWDDWLEKQPWMKVVSPTTVKFRWFSIAMVVFGGLTCWVRNHFEEKVCKLGRFLRTSRKRPNKQIPFAVKARFDKIYQGNMTLRQVHGHPCKTSPLRVLWTNCWAVGWWLKHSGAPQIWQEVNPPPCNSGVGEA